MKFSENLFGSGFGGLAHVDKSKRNVDTCNVRLRSLHSVDSARSVSDRWRPDSSAGGWNMAKRNFSRREFLQDSGTGIAGAVLLSSCVGDFDAEGRVESG